MLKVATDANIELADISRVPCVPQEMAKYDLVIVCNDDIFWHLQSINPDLNSNTVHLISQYSGQLGKKELIDPLQGYLPYDEALALAVSWSANLFDELQRSYLLE
jgi:hypothetical protein